MTSSKLFLFSKEVHLNSGVRLLLELNCVVVIKHVAFGKINSGIHMHQFTFEPLCFCFLMWLWSWIWTKILADRWIWRKKGMDRWICIPLFIPSPVTCQPCFPKSPTLVSKWEWKKKYTNRDDIEVVINTGNIVPVKESACTLFYKWIWMCVPFWLNVLRSSDSLN